MNILTLILQATPHVAVSPTPFDGNDYSAPSIWWGVLGVAIVLGVLFYFLGFRPIWQKKKGPGVHRVE